MNAKRTMKKKWRKINCKSIFTYLCMSFWLFIIIDLRTKLEKRGSSIHFRIYIYLCVALWHCILTLIRLSSLFLTLWSRCFSLVLVVSSLVHSIFVSLLNRYFRIHSLVHFKPQPKRFPVCSIVSCVCVCFIVP